MNRSIVIISNQGASFLRKGQMWMYANNLVNDISKMENGSVVDIQTEEGEYLATGLLSMHSHIVVRILTRDQNEEITRDFFRNRIQNAWELRKKTEPDNLTNIRIIYGEADGFPGLTIDRYNDVLVSQITAFGMEQRKEMIYGEILKVLRDDGQDVSAVYERNDIKAREKEGLPQYKGFYGSAALPTETVISENGLFLNVDFENGQKTGYFLDQKSNRLLIRNLSAGKRVCDCFTHTGGFALNAALGGAEHVTAVDVSASALAQAEANAELNHLHNIEFIQDDVFHYLDTIEEGQYDLIILDPPAFTKSRKTVMKAYNGYKRINMQAMKVLKSGAYLATCSCSRYMEYDLFEKMLKEAQSESGKKLKLVSVTYQNKDHPMIENMKETFYLKFYIFEIL